MPETTLSASDIKLVETTLSKHKLDGYKLENRLQQGMSNHTFLLSKDGNLYVLRIPPKGAEKYVNRVREEAVLNLISQTDISTKTIYFDVKTGVKIHLFVEGLVIENGFKLNSKYIKMYFKRLAEMHQIKLEDPNLSYDILKEIKLQIRKDIKYHKRFGEILDATEKLCEQYLPEQNNLIHTDLQLANIVYRKKECIFLDFEFAGGGNHNLDLAAFYSDIMPYDYKQFLKQYYHSKPSKEQILSFLTAILATNLRWFVIASNKEKDKYLAIDGLSFTEIAQLFYAKVESVLAEIAKYV